MSYCTIYNLFKVHFDTTAKFQISVFVERMTILKSECLDCDCVCFSCMRTDVLILLGLESICFISFFGVLLHLGQSSLFGEAYFDLLM